MLNIVYVKKCYFFDKLKNRETLKCPKCGIEYICIEQYYQDDDGHGEITRDLYLTDEYKRKR